MTTLTDREAQQTTSRRDAQAITPCSIDGCDMPVRARGWCAKHYGRWQRHGNPVTKLNLFIQGTETERFWAKVDPCRTDGCIVWLGAKNSNGYGNFIDASGQSMQAHHFLAGKPTEGLEADHMCRNRACVWPEHIEFVSHRVNVLRGVSPSSVNAVKDCCGQGHPFNPENTYVRNGARPGGRECRLCIRAREGRRVRR